MKTKFQGKEINIKRIGILTGGGDCAGHNAVIYGLLRRINAANQTLPKDEQMELIGLLEGWKALTRDPETEKDKIEVKLTTPDLKDSYKVAGTIIKSSRTNLFSKENLAKKAPEKAIENLKKLKIDCLVVLGGDDTLGAAGKLGKQFTFPMFGAPKTMDNDVYGTDKTYGFDSSVIESVHFIENIITTSKSHNRCFVVEVMGRHAGWVALYAGIAGGADVVLLPEEVVDMREVIKRVEKTMASQKYCVVVVSEGARLFDTRFPKEVNDSNKKLLDAVIADSKYALVKARHELPKKKDSFGNEQLGGIGEYIFSLLQEHTKGIQYRLQNCGHAIRGGIAHVSDRILGLRFGDAIFDFMKEGKFGVYPGLRGDDIVASDLLTVKGGKFVPDTHQLYKMRNAVDFY
ncbi:MAG: ATP-dependent 6-phosphofructokinase [Candidatus Margulisbacteria bacterium]|nr:ATP-dependent 6-phosphofructokinase [Candidatus Margulisiibacteriota bacterium]MBU1022532.1 ATP-dependent 6-phosphofructokinase [Candidatus Margulisiibacteriota bacterium]MBU1728818.1 ATP-dependent 6-phosphofructokinase [Candidatus Margulisiibacteriota bacterium]MBU1955784.1 ATP-dependent 6-phosphofructokinase [Candidatus Margulisiibacteriota bacterium]